jgi:RNA polymerase sigma factor
LEEYGRELAVWGIKLENLVKHSPKHKTLRDACRRAIGEILRDGDAVTLIFGKKRFPMKKISEITGLPLKKLERLRIYIMAVLIILKGDYEYLPEYIPAFGESAPGQASDDRGDRSGLPG